MKLGKSQDMKISQGLASRMRSEPITETHLGTEFVIDGASAPASGRDHVGTILHGNVLECQRTCGGLRPTARLLAEPSHGWRFFSQCPLQRCGQQYKNGRNSHTSPH